MLAGAIFPQLEIGTDPIAIRDYAQAAEGLGYNHILAYDHVLGASPAARPGWRGYTDQDSFHEPLVLFGYLAGLTQRIEFTPGVIVLPQRQTALVAKQAAEVDILSGGRLRLGVGVGWNAVEYEALGQDFHTRGQRIEEQIALLRQLFGQPLVTFAGRWHQVQAAGLNPLPVRRAIPIWIGTSATGPAADKLLARVAALGDGWFPQMRPEPEGRAAVEKLHAAAQAAGRDPATIGIEARISYNGQNLDDLAATARAWQALGATHIGVNTMGGGFAAPADHIAALGPVKAMLDRL
ncbi:MAG TPA: LLM class F420-dependent oxidoreductase [Chloroflexia bacterium]|nr:LLM class F420-dependent oxidoreductase [Chloroflexia bacterium]